MSGRQVVVARDLGEIWLALIEDGRVVELAVSNEDGARWLGTIAKGRITRLVPGVRAAFVDVGLVRDVFTVMPPGTIAERHLTPGDEVLVQVTREAQGGKGHRATFEVTVPGRALVLIPGASHRGVSKRIADPDERERLRVVLEDIGPDGVGLIARTAAVGLDRAALSADLADLLGAWREIEAQAAQVRAPAILYRDQNPAVAFLRDHLALGIDEVVTEGSDPADLAAALGGDESGTVPPIRAHQGPLRALDAYGLERAIAAALAPTVPLPGGGRLVIEASEALVAIDVNSGRDTAALDLDEIALRTNLEAAAEIGRQIRLRDLAGLIVVDFIDVGGARARAAVGVALAAALANDRAKLRVLPLTEFCLAQITRQRRRTPLARHFAEACPCCGVGFVPRADARARHLLRDGRRRARPYPRAQVRITAPAAVADAGREILAESDDRYPWDVAWSEGEDHVEVEPHP